MEFTSTKEFHNTILAKSHRHTRSLAIKSPRWKLYELDHQKMNPLHCAALVCDRQIFILILDRLKKTDKEEDRRIKTLREQVILTGETVLHIAARRLPKDDNPAESRPKAMNQLTRIKGKVENLVKILKLRACEVKENENKEYASFENKEEKTVEAKVLKTDSGNEYEDEEEEEEVDEVKAEFDVLSTEYRKKTRSFLLSENNFNLIEIIMEMYRSNDTGKSYRDDIEDENGRRALIACDEECQTLFHKAAILGNHLAMKKLFHWTETNEEIPQWLRDQDIALIDCDGETCLHKAVLASKTLTYKCDRNHELSERNLESIANLNTSQPTSYKCRVCDTEVHHGIVWRCPENTCKHNICDECYMKSKNALKEEQRTLGLNANHACSLFSRQVIKTIAEKMTLPQLLIPNKDKLTAFDLAVEKGKAMAAYWLRDIIAGKIEILRNQEQQIKDFQELLSHGEIQMDGLIDSFEKARSSKKQRRSGISATLFQGYYKDVKKKLKNALRVHWGEYARQSRDKTVRGYLYDHVTYFSDALQALKYVYDNDEAESSVFLYVHRKMREDDMFKRHEAIGFHRNSNTDNMGNTIKSIY